MPRLAKLKGPKDLKFNKVRQEYIERTRIESNAKRLAYKKAREAAMAAQEIDKPTRGFVRKHDTHARGITYVKDPEQTSTDLKQYGVWRGDDTVINGTVPTGEYAPPATKPDIVYDGCGNIIADKHNRPIIY
jgi:hypothetical protein